MSIDLNRDDGGKFQIETSQFQNKKSEERIKMVLTVKEIEAKGIKLQTEQLTALEAAKVLQFGTPEFDEAYARYLAAKAAIVKLPDEVKAAKVSENKVAIDAASVTAADAIGKLLVALGVADLIGAPVIALRYFVSESKDTAGIVTHKPGVVFNPITKVSTTGPKAKKTGKGHNMIIAPDGTRLSLTKFVLATATDAEKASAEFKYPHVRVDSKPKFEAYVTGHNLGGYTYQMAGDDSVPPVTPAA